MYFFIFMLCLNTRTSMINTNVFFDFLALVSNWADAKYAPQAYGYTIWVLILDFCMWLRMRRGTCNWGPGKTVLLIAMTRYVKAVVRIHAGGTRGVEC